MTARATLRSTLNRVFDPVLWHLSRRSLLKELSAAPSRADAASILSILDRYRGWGWYRRIAASQSRAELTQLIETVRGASPRNIMEIGTARGGTLLAWCRLASRHVISIDLPGGRHGGGYVPQRQRLYQLFSRDRSGLELTLIRDDSKSPAVHQQVETRLGGEKLQFLFIDGDHTYAGVKRDFEIWADLVEEGGLIAFHDIADHGGRFGVEVDRFWREVRQGFPHNEFVEREDQGWAGIGVLRM